MISRELTIQNRLGLHARAAARLVHLASRFHAKVLFSKDGISVDGKSILGLLTLSAPQGSNLKLTVEGIDEQEAARQIAALVESRFGEEA